MKNNLILSIFPGIDILGMGFEKHGFCVVRGPDLIFGGNIKTFHPPSNVFAGIIGGPPCQDFSAARRIAPTGYGLEMFQEFGRVVLESSPEWFLLENSDRAPSISIPGYKLQRIALNARELGSVQNRPRHFQFGSKSGLFLVIRRQKKKSFIVPTVTTNSRNPFHEDCALQGLPADFDIPCFTQTAKRRAIGNAVHLDVANEFARAIKDAKTIYDEIKLCPCGCGRALQGRQKSATATCRKRLQIKRDRKDTNENIFVVKV